MRLLCQVLSLSLPLSSIHIHQRLSSDSAASIKHSSPSVPFPSFLAIPIYIQQNKLTYPILETSTSRHRYLQQSNVNPKLLRQRYLCTGRRKSLQSRFLHQEI